MGRYMMARVAQTLLTLLGTGILVFISIRFIPGDVVVSYLGTEASVSEQTRQALAASFGVDQPLHVQLARWIGQIVRGDLGQSWYSGLPVRETIWLKLPVTFELSFFAMVVAVVLGVPLGIIVATRQDSLFDHAVRVVSLLGVSTPSFLTATLAVLILSKYLHWIPPMSYESLLAHPGENLQMMIAPSLVLGVLLAGPLLRMTRACVIDVLDQGYIRTARAKGLSELLVICRHALRNALIPLITVMGMQIGSLLSGTVITEEIFALPGLGRLMLRSVGQRDLPVVQGTAITIAFLFILVNMVVDLAYGFIDPRIHHRTKD